MSILEAVAVVKLCNRPGNSAVKAGRFRDAIVARKESFKQVNCDAIVALRIRDAIVAFGVTGNADGPKESFHVVMNNNQLARLNNARAQRHNVFFGHYRAPFALSLTVAGPAAAARHLVDTDDGDAAGEKFTSTTFRLYQVSSARPDRRLILELNPALKRVFEDNEGDEKVIAAANHLMDNALNTFSFESKLLNSARKVKSITCSPVEDFAYANGF